jgi:hypothetical protein
MVWTATRAKSVLMNAFYGRFAPIVKALDDGFCPAAEALYDNHDFINYTLLHFATEWRTLHSLVPRLLEAGWDPNAGVSIVTPLRIAFRAGNLFLIKTLCAAGASLSMEDAMHWARYAWEMPSNLAIATWLVDQQMDLTWRDRCGLSLVDNLRVEMESCPTFFRTMPNRYSVLCCLQDAIQRQEARWNPARSAWLAACCVHVFHCGITSVK